MAHLETTPGILFHHQDGDPAHGVDRAVAAEHDGRDGAFMVPEHVDIIGHGRIPQPNGTIAAGRRDARIIRVPCQ